VYLLPAEEICPKTVTAKIAAIIQNRGPRKILWLFVGGFFVGCLPEKLFLTCFLGF
jgi:uncharacterized membrane protein